jgi:hypothetical protein
MGDVIEKKIAGGKTEELNIRAFSIKKFPVRGKIGLTRVVPRNPPHRIMNLIEEWLETKDANDVNVTSLKHFFEKCKKSFLTRVSSFFSGRKTCPGELGQGKSRLGHFEQSYNASSRREDEFYKVGENVILPYGISSYGKTSADLWNKQFDGIYLDGRDIVDAVGRPHIIATWFKAAPYEGEGGFIERFDQHEEHDRLMKEFLTKIARINGPPPGRRPREGKNTFEYPNGDIYEGEWKDGKMHGSGTYTFNNEDTKTQFLDTNTNPNQYRYKNDTLGDVYDGQFKADKPDGLGTYKFADGRVEISLYEDGLPVRKGVRWSRDRTKAAMVIDGKIYVQVGQRNSINDFQEYEKEPHEASELAMQVLGEKGLTKEKLNKILESRNELREREILESKRQLLTTPV